ncbi:MAG: class I SAM-dependent methyltransferase [Spirochaetia bacterium]
MKDYKPIMSFDNSVAETYRDIERGDEVVAVTFLEQLAGRGPALELAIGAGRIALPLAARGIRVDGIDISPAMLAQLRTKPGGKEISMAVGDFADVPVEGNYSLIFVVWNSLFNLLTQEDQVRCFQNVAGHLTNEVDAEAILVDEVRLDVLRHDMSTQMIEESHVSLSAAGVRLNPVVQRYAWPAELDLMARVAGLRLKQRWGGWNREPFNSTSSTHISVYGR